MQKIDKILVLLMMLIVLFIGSFALAWDLILEGSIREMFDDNIYSDENREYDFITNFTFGLGAEHEGKTQTFSILGHVYQDIYGIHFKEMTTNSQDLELIYTKQFTFLHGIQLSDVFHHYPEPHDFDYLFGRFDDSEGYYSNTLNFLYNGIISKHFGLDLRYINEITINLRNDYYNSYVNGAGTNLNFFIDSANNLFLYYDFMHTFYENNYEMFEHVIGAGYQHYFTRQFYMDIRAGFGYIHSEENENYSPVLGLSFVNDIDENNTLTLEFSLDHNVSSFANDIFQYWNISINFTRQFLPRLMFSTSAFYGQGKYLSSEIGRRLFGGDVSISYELSEHMVIGFDYIFTYGSNFGGSINNIEFFRNRIELFFTVAL